MIRHARRTALGVLVGLVVPAALAGAASPSTSGSDIRVPEDVATLQAAVGQAAPGDTIVLSAGTYPGGVVVPRAKRDITIRGVDRNEVVLDGADRRKDGILVHADGVSILNLSAHNFLRNGFYSITSTGRARVPIRTALAGFVGIGVAIAGGNENIVATA